MTELHDIETRDDIERLVRAFYGRALEDEIIGWLFTDVAKLDVEAHVPQIASFWETVLLGVKSYNGSPFPPHYDLHMKAGLKPGHFARWVALWETTVDELFSGERATMAKAHALRVAQAFSRRLQDYPARGGVADPPEGLLPMTQHVPKSD
ncbi:MAG: group III truncated hemoglobin [Solirubrobacteraceae bacterium]|nr:group III truncated hemoglobin [Solirubrobacteraceae bacterium]